MTRVALLETRPAVLADLRSRIASQRDMHVGGAAATAPELARQLGRVRADVLLIDADAAAGEGISRCVRIKSRSAAPAVVLYTARPTGALIMAARAAQADGLLDRSAPQLELVNAIRRVAAGEPSFPEVPLDGYRAAVNRIEDEDLPVLALLLDRGPSAAAADALGYRPGETDRRVRRIMRGLCHAALDASSQACTDTTAGQRRPGSHVK